MLWETTASANDGQLDLVSCVGEQRITFRENPRAFRPGSMSKFYIDASHDSMYGLDYSAQTNQDGFRIIYFDQIVEDVNNLVTDFDFLEEHQETTFKFHDFFQLPNVV
ncbi:DUF1963 domain-containing protein [Okeania sp. KiyG1]|uniref:DUF1963 domain-containing protein n=1 Tax=Okeania sp. KiyG1 TaxID=2720165 RepID=UPI0019244487|nr:hypothetical protein CYANOKiyG1_11750 [Okeania sp. KiyG1]